MDRSMIRYGCLVALVFVVGATAAIAAATYVDSHPPRTLPGAVLFLIGGGLIAVGVIAPFVAVSMRRAREHRQLQTVEEFAAIDAAAAKIKHDALGPLVSFNFRLMDRFINVALTQAKAAYLLCAVSAGAALLVLLTGATALLTVESGVGQLSISLLTGAGAALSGFISLTFMNTFRMTSRQMSYYYGQPLVHCYLLHAEWLAERAAGHDSPTAGLDDELIRATLDAGRAAQHHLLTLLDTHKSAPPAAAHAHGSDHGHKTDGRRDSDRVEAGAVGDADATDGVRANSPVGVSEFKVVTPAGLPTRGRG